MKRGKSECTFVVHTAAHGTVLSRSWYGATVRVRVDVVLCYLNPKAMSFMFIVVGPVAM